LSFIFTNFLLEALSNYEKLELKVSFISRKSRDLGYQFGSESPREAMKRQLRFVESLELEVEFERYKPECYSERMVFRSIVDQGVHSIRSFDF
jgi:hypothetical protein